MVPNILFDGPVAADVTVVLAHGAGASMESAPMQMAAQALADVGFRVARFEFAYMAARRSGSRRPPPRAEMLSGEYGAMVDALGAEKGALIIGGKSMGGRVASMIADDLYASGRIDGLLCLGYPFHPPKKPAQLRVDHLAALQTPALICQGTRDAFGSFEEVGGYALSDRIEMLWLEDGDHDLKPRRKMTGLTAADHMKTVAKATRAWVDRTVS